MKKTIIPFFILFILIFSFSVYALDDSTLYNVYNFRVNADFEIDMGSRFNNMIWVPASSLGKPEINKVDIYDLKNDIKMAQKEIDNVYEALMFVNLFFDSSSGNLKVRSKNIEWEFSEPIELVFETKTGNCAGMSNLVDYLLEGDYEEEGLMWRHMNKNAKRNGGHIINYVKHNGRYYFFDVLSVTKSNDSYPVENGSMREQGRVDWADPVIMAKPEEYMKFINSAADFSLFAMIKNIDYSIGKGADKFYLPHHLDNSNTKIYVTKTNKWDIKKAEINLPVPQEYKGYNQYSEYKDESSDKDFKINTLDF
ncbi:hypothetical protein C8C77_11956 [Halanaerobium saccharolyticum]|uniref:Transglutaminase superfamily protein n=1 Tax=Halanaerobium saccharolyticum TaxID=43595 RepID=A0A4R7YV38_9FIRM|nr:hypothetical protein [Halanaerobium saccharolyticum]RAK06965.1 hypothetical protein C7958_11856 [Halanaerobium saccharolyticum]TDW01692.1 hypothetical protein C8C77_11956 [Halanaerobium saccharolyticum]TDX53090.1 hypothetical protein C7956_11956 [Halanaerobium saccharolyticum]